MPSVAHMTDALALDGMGQAEAIRRGEVSASELVEAAIAAVEKVNPQINAVIHKRYERARQEAAATNAAGTNSAPLAGVPIVAKDLLCQMDDEPYHLGTRVLKQLGYRAEGDSHVYSRLRAAGCIVIGRTNVPEFGSTITTEPLAYGPTRNPWNLDHSTGGSSGGSAAAVAAGCVAIGHGNDGGGSIRVPASECGLVGLKPSRGRISIGPQLGETWLGGVVEGCLTRSVRDTAFVLDILQGYEPGDPNVAPPPARPYRDEVGAPVEKLRIGVLDSPLLPTGLDHPDTRASIAAAAKLFSELGHDVEVTHPPALNEEEFGDKFLSVVIAGVAADVGQLEKRLGRELTTDDIEPSNWVMHAFGKATNVVDYLDAVYWMHRWSRRVIEWWLPGNGKRGFDVLLAPVIAGPPPRIGELSGDDATERLRAVMQYTAQFNMTGQPGISLPLFWNAAGLPMGVQCVAAPFREDVLLRLAAQVEAAAPWAHRRPAIHA